MNYKEFNMAIPIKDNNVVIVDGIVQYDTANIFNVRLMEGVEPFDFTGYTEIVIDIQKPDGTHINTCITDDPTISNDNNPYHIQVVDMVGGRISFTLHGQATILTGTHFGQIMIAGNGKILSSARINYYVGDTLLEDSSEITSTGEYTTLLTLINRNSSIATAERDRIDSETLRKLAELEREKRSQEQAEYVQGYIDNAEMYIAQTENYMNLAYKYAQLAQNPSAEIMQDLVSSLDLASEGYVDIQINNATKNFDAGNYSDTAEEKKLLKVRRGTKKEEIILEEGELGYSTDTKIAYIGSGDDNLPLNGVFVSQPTEPSITHVLWIDTSVSGKGAIKYYDGLEWQPTATAVFS